MIKKIFPVLILIFVNASGQPLRKSVFSLAAGYVSGDNSLAEKNSSQLVLWGNYAYSSLDEISVVYKKFQFSQDEKSYNENFFAVNGKVNLFPFYFSASAGKLKGIFNPRESYPDASADIFAFEATYYKNLFFYTFAGKFVNIDWQTNEKIFTGEGKITWRPTKYFSATLGGLVSQSDYDSLYKAVSVEFFWQPLDFFNISFLEYFGERRFYYNPDYMIFYSLPYTEKGARSFYLRFYLWKKLGLILNYEYRDYDLFSAEFYSISIRYDFIF